MRQDEGRETVADQAGMDRLSATLAERGWSPVPGDDSSWTLRCEQAGQIKSYLRSSGPTIIFDEEDPEAGFYVEGPMVRDEFKAMLQYRTVAELLSALDRIEGWVHPQVAGEIDPSHVGRPPLPRWGMDVVG